MTRSKLPDLNGLLVIDKPGGMTSRDAVNIVQRWFPRKTKIGHTGTLDPLATGVLVLCIGPATKLADRIQAMGKTYVSRFRLGATSDTDDADGTITENTVAVAPTKEQVEAALASFVGVIQQVPPAYSALKVGGARAYDLAREDQDFELAARPALIDSLELIDMPDRDHCVIEAACGKGTYVRALARDLGEALGSLAHVTELRRTKVGPFSVEAAISLAKLEELGHSAAGRDALLGVLKPVQTALDDIPALAISGQDAARLKRGQPVLLRGRDAPILKGPVYATSRGSLVAVGEVSQGELRPTRVFNLPG